MPYLIFALLWIGPTFAKPASPAPAPPRISSATLPVNSIEFSFPLNNRPEFKVTIDRLAPLLRAKLEGKADRRELEEKYRTFVRFNVCKGDDFGSQFRVSPQYDSHRYEITWSIPAWADLREVEDFVDRQIAFLPDKDWAHAPRRPYRPIGHRPTFWNRCTDRLKFSAPPRLL